MSELESHKRSNQESTWISKQGRKGKEVQLTKATMRIFLEILSLSVYMELARAFAEFAESYHRLLGKG